MAGFTASSADNILSEIHGICEEIPKQILTAVHSECIKRFD
jgi:hypothetical protein